MTGPHRQQRGERQSVVGYVGGAGRGARGSEVLVARRLPAAHMPAICSASRGPASRATSPRVRPGTDTPTYGLYPTEQDVSEALGRHQGRPEAPPSRPWHRIPAQCVRTLAR